MASYWWWLAAAPLGVVVVGLLLTRPRKTMAGDMTEPMDLERGRAKSEAAMTAPLSDADADAAAPLVAYVEKIGTGEQLVVQPADRFETDPLNAPIPPGLALADPVLWLSGKADLRVRYNALSAFPEPPAEPEQEPALDFTGSWTAEARRELAALLAADAEAGARR